MLALTVAMEARGEPYLGQVAVARTALNRSRRWKSPLIEVLLASYEFSVWNTQRGLRRALSSLSQREIRLARLGARTATVGPFDPSRGATHFLNVEKVLATRGTLPPWFDISRVTTQIGRHTFLNLDRSGP